MKTSSYYQKGFLAIVAVLLVVILAFIAVTATYQFTGDTLASVSHLKSAQAFYVAEGGLANAKTSIVGGANCGTYSSGTVTLGQGQYSVTGAETHAVSTLSSAIVLPTATTIPLANASGFASKGVVLIDNELIGYTGISGNNLMNALRGEGGTTASTHLINANVIQDQCLLTSTGAVPNFSTPLGERILQTALTGATMSVSTGSGGYNMPALIALGNIIMSGSNTATNPAATLTSPNYPGSTIFSGGSITHSGVANTLVGNGIGGMVPSSTSALFLPDIVQNSNAINSGNLNSMFFSQPLATIIAGAVTTYTAATITNAGGETIYMSGTLVMSGTKTIGTPTNPVILILGNGMIVSGTTTVNGFVYIVGGGLTSSGTLTVNGAFAIAGNLTLSGNNNFNLSPAILTQLGIVNSNVVTHYNNIPILLQENFP